ncbi:MAG: preprotein translocase subunit SecG [Alphaproteobacteria bacterium]|nr:preprotein translocase subunit SecG [Alphaproteobacteria bacterium]
MSETLLAIHLIVILAMIILVLLQRSEGGALGIGGGQGGGLFSGRGVADTLTKITAILAVGFFLTSIGLTVLGSIESRDSLLDDIDDSAPAGVIEAPAPILPPLDLDASPELPPLSAQ